jgi:hypothetical protein
MQKRNRRLLAAAFGVGLIGAGVGVGLAATQGDRSGSDAEAAESADAEQPIAGSDADAAAAAALRFTDDRYAPGGRVVEVEAGDDGAAYGVEVALPDGRQVEVHLDADFTVTGDEADDD